VGKGSTAAAAAEVRSELDELRAELKELRGTGEALVGGHKSRPVSFTRALAAAIARPDSEAGKAMSGYFDEIESALYTLADRVKALQAGAGSAPAARYRGVWQGADSYSRGDMATRGGQLWHCNAAEPTTDKPGTGPSWP
jgi:hypothetical protein